MIFWYFYAPVEGQQRAKCFFFPWNTFFFKKNPFSQIFNQNMMAAKSKNRLPHPNYNGMSVACVMTSQSSRLHRQPWPVKFISPSTSVCRTVTLGWGFERWCWVLGSSGSFYDRLRAAAGGGSISQHCARLLQIFQSPWAVWWRSGGFIPAHQVQDQK